MKINIWIVGPNTGQMLHLHRKFIWVKYKQTKFYDTPNSKMKGRKKGKMSRYVTDHGF